MLKNKLLISLFTLLSAGFFQSCFLKSKSEKLGLEQIKFGSGGGITGKYADYQLDIKEKTLAKPDGSKAKISAVKISDLLKTFKSAKLGAFSYNTPGNMNQYIEFLGKENKKILWEKDKFPSTEVKEFYKKLIELADEK
jgi:hypothetical protein